MVETPLGKTQWTFTHPGVVSSPTIGTTGTVTFYAAATSGGSPTTLNTVTIVGGSITSWTQTTSGSGSGYQFDDADNSIYLAIW